MLHLKQRCTPSILLDLVLILHHPLPLERAWGAQLLVIITVHLGVIVAVLVAEVDV